MAVVAAAPLLGSAPVAAQWFDDDQPMPPRAAVRIAARHGFTDFSLPRLAGDVYIFNALADNGARVRLVIDAYSGRILRPLGVSADLAPPRPTRRLRPWDYAPAPDDDEDELERQPVERFRRPRLGREDLVPPRPIGRERPSDLPLSRDAEIDLDRRLDESVRGPGPQREQRPTPAVRGEPNRKAARIEQPAREPAGPAPTGRPRGADRTAPTPPAAPAPVVETPAPPVQAKPETTAAVPPPTVPKSEPTAPAAAPRPDAVAPQKQAKPQPPAATASTSPPKVRVIEGVTPVVPQNTAPAEPGSSSEPRTIAQ